jgi:hypothetical protein
MAASAFFCCNLMAASCPASSLSHFCSCRAAKSRTVAMSCVRAIIFSTASLVVCRSSAASFAAR